MPVRPVAPPVRDPGELAEELAAAPPGEIPRLLAAARFDPPELLERMRAEASHHYHSDAARARGIAERACIAADVTGDLTAVGWSRRALAESRLFSGKMREAEEAYAVAARAWREAGATALLGQLLVGRIHVLALLGRMEAVERSAREARRHLEAAGDGAYLAKLAMNLGNLHFQRDEHAEALAEYERAAEAFARIGVRDEAVVGLEVNRAVALTQLDRDEDALDLFRRLERECERQGFDLLRAQVRMNAAYVHFLRADFDPALRDLAAATDYFRRTSHPAFLASCLLNRAEVYHQLNLHVDARELAAEAAATFAAEALRYDRALALSQGAMAALALGEPALSGIREARSLFRQEANPSRAALMELLWARALGGARRRSSSRGPAAARARRARDEFRRLRLLRWEAEAAALWLELEWDRLPAARRGRVLADLLRRLPPRTYPLQAIRLLELHGRAQEEAGRIGLAARTLARAAARLETLRTRIPSEDSKIAFLGDKTHLFDRILGLELRRARPRPERLFEWMERSRAQSLWDRMRDPSAPETAQDPEAAQERRRLSWLHARVSRLELGNAEERSRADALRAELRRAEQRWSRWLRVRAETGERDEAGRAPSNAASEAVWTAAGTGRAAGAGGSEAESALLPAAIARALAPGYGFLSYHLAPGGAIALAITESGAAWRRLAPDLAVRLARLADRLDFQWGAAAVSSVRRAASSATLESPPAARPPEEGVSGRGLRASTDAVLGELYDLLWRPLEEMGLPEGRHWIISPHGAIHRIPFPALRDRRGYLIERTSVSMAPSARVWMALPAEPEERARRRAWIAGVPSAALPAVDREVRGIARRLEGKAGWDARIDFAPTRDALRSAGASSGLVHLAAHGSFRRDNPAFSFVELADGPLFAHDLAGLRFAGSLAVLTACSWGRGAAPAGDEWIGLARGFLQAGASAVVASLWPIPDEPTCELMEEFYCAYAAGRSVPQALAEGMRRQMERRPHPWNWAGFACLGASGRR